MPFLLYVSETQKWTISKQPKYKEAGLGKMCLSETPSRKPRMSEISRKFLSKKSTHWNRAKILKKYLRHPTA